MGPGPNVIGALGVPAPQDPEHDMLLALQRWVEEGVAPEHIIATKYVGDDPAKGVARSSRSVRGRSRLPGMAKATRTPPIATPAVKGDAPL